MEIDTTTYLADMVSLLNKKIKDANIFLNTEIYTVYRTVGKYIGVQLHSNTISERNNVRKEIVKIASSVLGKEWKLSNDKNNSYFIYFIPKSLEHDARAYYLKKLV